MKILRFFYPALTLFAMSWIVSCNNHPDTLFILKDGEETGIHFTNRIEETDSFNILSYEYIYNGGGVGVADFNNDGLQDIFFSGNQVQNRLYLNQGNFKFKDITELAKVNVEGRWSSGVAIVDINNDGWMDIYVCATTNPNSEDRRNMLFVNEGANANGEPVFKEMAANYKIDSDSHSIMAAFLDYDHDGDLDLYVLVNQKLTNTPTNYRPKITDGSSANNDRLFRNDGDGTFSDVTLEAGIIFEGFGLGLAITDVNVDGWPDIYVSNDFLSNDILYINNQDGTFKNGSAEWLGHQSQFSMGNDAADINNDALPDIITLDMLPETSARKKTTIGNKSYLTYINNEKYGYEYQYVRNMVHLNNGMNHGVKFSEIGQLSGIYQTEWSWSPLIADFDNDGSKDLIITNGFPKDITDKDFANFRADVGNLANNSFLIDSIPIIKIPNYAYRNNGDLTFTDVTKKWGMDLPSFSNGAAFADLDNDGDLDYIVNNINDEAFVFENTLQPQRGKNDQPANFLRIKLTGSDRNRQAMGSKVWVYYDSGKMQYTEQTVYRGFLSSVEGICHFGLGNTTRVDSVVVRWPDGNRSSMTTVPVNQQVTMDYGSFQNIAVNPVIVKAGAIFEKANETIDISYIHTEEDNIDFDQQRTLPHKFSQSGPGLSVGDVDGNGMEDLIVGGSTHYNFTALMQMKDGSFKISETPKDESKVWEDEGMLLFDADNDGDLDLYIVSGSVESPDTAVYQDRLFTNDGSGNFKRDVRALPQLTGSGSCVRAADFDGDGDLDLFVGGRVVPLKYPTPPESYLLRNNNGVFTDVTNEVSPSLKSIGMVTDALWTDFNSDGKVDLVVVGEFMPITFFENRDGKLSKLEGSGIDGVTGWWNSIVGGDFDKDGDTDYVVGNLGLNNSYQVKAEFPLKVFAKDFDGNGSIDPVMACYMRESMDGEARKLYPVHFWDELNSQSPKFRNKFSKYKQYSLVTIDQIFTPEELKGSLILEANHMASSYIENLGDGKFMMSELPTLAQVAPINGMLADDVNDDGNLDIIVVGNDYGNEVFAGRYDALNGLVLLGDGRGKFGVTSTTASGFYVKGDAKALVNLFSVNDQEIIIASQNRDSLMVFRRGRSPDRAEVVKILPMESHADITYVDGKKQRVEFYYGAGYLSQPSRRLIIPPGTAEVIIYDYRGNSRKVTPANL